MPYFLFLLVTATLFIRPAEVVPAVHAWPIYQCLILVCLAVSLPCVLNQLSPKALADNPITACVVGLLAAVVLSHLSHFFIWGARMGAMMFLKQVVYYVLLVGVVNTEDRIKRFLHWLSLFVAVLALLALVDRYEIVDIPSISVLEEGRYDAETGERIITPRLRSTGIFNDPNDLAMILVAGVVIGVYQFTDPAAGILRPMWLALSVVYFYSIYLTQSRGGLLALMAALGTLAYFRWGWRRTAIAAMLVLPVLLVVLKGRITTFESAMEHDTGQSRIQVWAEGLGLFQQAPLFGVGQGLYAENVGHVAHNSFVHCFAELGFFGGALFLGAFVAALAMFYRLRDDESLAEYGELKRLLPYVAAILVGFAFSMLSLSRPYVTPTYLVLGLATAYVRVASPGLLCLPLRLNWQFVKCLTLVSVLFILGTYVFIRTFVRWT